MIKAFSLPDLARGVAGFVDFTCGESFPALKDFGKGVCRTRGDEEVDVVRHDDVAKEEVTVAVEMF